ncbi:hypothetical protein INE86_02645 [Parabacteroides distasonis]|uniref:hypothetical protein n=1 Tax=Parabacteroides distasonis TaxID=823 RepID=UPI001BA5A8BC|nr:hypothetical protein [Parabacteroides distasonis]QUT54118.1 hypothetical protein INE86_02645 [Parabacteroides distasonis]
MNTQICTNKEQSARLLEAGVRPETADMVILYIDNECNVAGWKDIRKDDKGQLYYDVYGETYILRKEILPVDNPYYDHSYQNDCPAWSLSKLIDMMPKSYQDDIDGMVYYLSGNFVELMYASDWIKDGEGDNTYNCAKSFDKENLMDNVVDAIEWLIKRGHLNNKFLTDKCGDCRLIEDEDANGEAWCSFHQKPVRCDSRACEDILVKGGSND